MGNMKYQEGTKIKMSDVIGEVVKHNIPGEIHVEWDNGHKGKYAEYFLDIFAEKVE